MANGTSPDPDYYTTRGRKVGDFFMGMFGLYACLSAFYLLVFGLSRTAAVWEVIWIIATLVLFGGPLVAIVMSFRKGRRFLGIGMISGIVFPLLFVGACFAIFVAAMS